MLINKNNEFRSYSSKYMWKIKKKKKIQKPNLVEEVIITKNNEVTGWTINGEKIEDR